MPITENALTSTVGAARRPPPDPDVPFKPKPKPKSSGFGGKQVQDAIKKAVADAKAKAAAKDAAAKAEKDAAAAKENEKYQADALATLTMMLQAWGLDSLTGTVIGMIQQDYSTNQILLELRKSDAYKKRFSGNEARIKNGYAALEPADYLQVEDAYQRILQSAGLPKGFYDSPDDFASWIGNNVSATEISERVGFATDAALNSDPHYLEALGQMGLNTGDLTAAMLDQNRALPVLRKTIGTSKLGAASLGAGLGFNQDRANKFYSLLADANGGIDSQFAHQAYSTVAAALPRANSLSSMYGEQVDQGTLEDEFLGRNELASQKRRRLANLEMAQYQGTGGLGEKGLSQKSRGEY